MSTPIDIHSALRDHLNKKFPDKKVSEEVLNFFFSSKVIEKKSVLRMIIKSRYFDLLKEGKSVRSSSLDCAVEFGVSQTFVQNLVYKQRNIRV